MWGTMSQAKASEKVKGKEAVAALLKEDKAAAVSTLGRNCRCVPVAGLVQHSTHKPALRQFRGIHCKNPS